MAGAGAGVGAGVDEEEVEGGDCDCECGGGSAAAAWGCDRSDRTDQVGRESREAMSVSWAGAFEDQECDLARLFCLRDAVFVFATGLNFRRTARRHRLQIVVFIVGWVQVCSLVVQW